MAVGFLSRARAEGPDAPVADVYAFGPFVLNIARHTLTRDGRPVTLTPKGFELLLLLVRSGGRVVSRQELVAALWPDTFVEEGNLSFQMSALRKALGGPSGNGASKPDDAEAWIETVPKVGYRFAGHVVAVASDVARSPRRVHGWRVSAATAAGAAIAVGLLAWKGTNDSPTRPRSPYGTTAVPLTSYPGGEGSPSFSPDGTQVAFSWAGSDDGALDIYVKLVGDGEPVRLTRNPRTEFAPSWSPDGHRIAFLRPQGPGGPVNLMVLPSLGGTERRVASLWPSGHPLDQRGISRMSWTPDGRWLAIGAEIEGQWGIWLVEVDGPGRRRLTETPPRRVDRAPRVSADGRRLAFVRGGPMSHAVLMVVALQPDLTAAGLPREVVDPWPRQVGSVAWDADRASLVYAVGGHMGLSRLELVRLGPDGLTPQGSPESLPVGDQATGLDIAASGRLVYVRRLRDSGFWTLDIKHPQDGVTEFPVLASSFDEHTPHFSPDGRRLVFASTRSGTEEIWIANVDGSNPLKMTAMGGPLCANPQWSPDGRQVVFNSARAGSSDLYLLDPETADLRRLTSDPGWEDQPRWSRDGRWIYFAARADWQPLTEIWKISPDGGEAIQVTNGGGSTAEESHDGRALYVTRVQRPSVALWRVPLDGGPESQVASDVTGTLNFAVGRRAVYFLSRPPGGATRVEAVDIATGRRDVLASFGRESWWGLTVSPDERRLIISAVKAESLDLMVVEPAS